MGRTSVAAYAIFKFSATVALSSMHEGADAFVVGNIVEMRRWEDNHS